MEEIGRKMEQIFGKGSSRELENAVSKEKIVERIEEISKRETQFDIWERMREESKRRQREDRRLNLFWRKNRYFPAQFGGEDERLGIDETLSFWRGINDKETSERWKEDMYIRESLNDVKWLIGKGKCADSVVHRGGV